MKKNLSTENNLPWAANTEASKSRKEEMKEAATRGAQLCKSHCVNSLAEDLMCVAEGIRGGTACDIGNIEFSAITCDQAADALAFVGKLQEEETLKKKKQKIADLCKEKPAKDPESLMGELDLAMDKVLNNEGNSFDVAETIGAAMDYVAQVGLHRKLPVPVEDEGFELPAVLRDVAEILECGDETHPQNRKIILDAVWETLEHLGAKPPKGISSEALHFASEKLLEVDEILAKLSKESMSESQTKLVIALAENLWGAMAKLIPSSDSEESLEDSSFVESGADLHALYYAIGAVRELETPENEEQIALILSLLEQVSDSVKEG